MRCQQFADVFVLKKYNAKANVLSAKWANPSALDALERFLADWERDNGYALPPKAPPTGKKVAVVGAGPAGLTAAADLVKLGHEITMFEALHVGGGVLIVRHSRVPFTQSNCAKRSNLHPKTRS